MKCFVLASVLTVTITGVTSGHSDAATFVVDALVNSVFNTPGLDTISLSEGQAFRVSLDPDDLWSAGPLPRWSNANGLTGNRYATGSDESSEPAGTLIGIDWGVFAFDGFVAPFGSLVGRVGNGSYFKIGTKYSGRASSTGTLTLFYWDGFSDDNFGTVTAEVSAIPLPGSMALQLTAMVGGGAFIAWRRRLLPTRAKKSIPSRQSSPVFAPLPPLARE